MIMNSFKTAYMDKILVGLYESPAGEMILGSFRGCVCLCDWLDNPRRVATDRRIRQTLKAEYCIGGSIIRDREELREYSTDDPDIILKAGEGNEEYSAVDPDIIQKVRRELNEFFAGKRRDFSEQVVLSGTSFQSRVWNELRKIPYGETISYSELARRLGNPKAIRAVATAVACNPISIILPCHRVIGSDGSLTGYAGGIPAKKLLLSLEKNRTETSLI